MFLWVIISLHFPTTVQYENLPDQTISRDCLMGCFFLLQIKLTLYMGSAGILIALHCCHIHLQALCLPSLTGKKVLCLNPTLESFFIECAGFPIVAFVLSDTPVSFQKYNKMTARLFQLSKLRFGASGCMMDAVWMIFWKFVARFLN